MIRQYLQAIAAVLLIASWLTVSAISYRAGSNAVVAKQAHDDQRLQAVEERAQRGTAKALAGIKVTNRNIYNEVQRETRVVPDYSACRQSADGLRNVNAALAGPVAVTTGDRVVPAADSTH